MTARSIATLIALGTIATISSACDGCMKNVVVGKAQVLGNGLVWSWAKLDKKGNPLSVGITMTETALTGLPTKDEMPPGPEPTMEYILDVPAEIKGKPFEHIGFHWNPVGHPPVKIYDVPHFDVHFYTITPEERKLITAQGEDLKRCQAAPEPQFMPAGYILPPDTIVPTMGAHWVDLSTPEVNGKPFSTTFLHGTYNGQLIFWEPMITLDFLQNKPNYVENLKTPAAYLKAGHYPTRYRVQYNEARKEITIALDGLTYREGALGKVAAK